MAGHVLQVNGDEQVRALLPMLLTRAQRRAIVPSKCGCFVGRETAVRSAAGSDAVALLVGLQAELCTSRRERFPVIPICSSTSKIDACTETHINRRYPRTGKLYILR